MMLNHDLVIVLQSFYGLCTLINHLKLDVNFVQVCLLSALGYTLGTMWMTYGELSQLGWVKLTK